jgi:DNA-binding PadR family transcriptional regulator
MAKLAILEGDKAIVLAAIREFTQRSGAQLAEITKLGSHRLYPALFRLEKEKAITSDWEPGPYPRRRRYKLAEPQQL